MKSRYTTKLFATKPDTHCSCDRNISGGENCSCGSSGYTLYGIYDRKRKRFTKHRKVDEFWRKDLIQEVKELNRRRYDKKS